MCRALRQGPCSPLTGLLLARRPGLAPPRGGHAAVRPRPLPQITPAQAGLAWAVPKARRDGGSRAGGFPGAAVVLAESRDGPSRVRRGLRPEGRAPIREGAALYADASSTDPIATVTSGGFGPTVGAPIAMAMLPAGTGHTVVAELRGRRIPVGVVDLPFITPSYKR